MSGNGRELGEYGMQAYTEVKAVCSKNSVFINQIRGYRTVFVGAIVYHIFLEADPGGGRGQRQGQPTVPSAHPPRS